MVYLSTIPDKDKVNGKLAEGVRKVYLQLAFQG
jgi:hypothetical protein